MKSLKSKAFIYGLLFTFIIAVISLLGSKLPFLDKIGALTIAILIAILYRHFKGYPEAYRSGIAFSSKRLLKLAIILYGLKLNIYDVIGKGSDLVLIDIGVILFSIGLMLLLNKYIKGDKNLILLLGIGTGVCGAAAIAAVSPILKSREKDSAISIGIVALIGTIFSLAYTVIYSIFTISPEVFGVWSGTSLHEIAHVILASDFSGQEALSMGLLGKLGRVFLLIPLSIILILILIMRKKSHSENEKKRIDVPYFLLGFVMMALFHTYVSLPHMVMQIIDNITTICLLMAMVALGLNVSFKDLKDRAFKPLIAVIIVSICLSTVTFIVAKYFYS
ncbi:YeiH family protein [Staphylococcus aureus]|uniref:YeiH family protein n=14 Tax=Bacteria TaxID=2 RepID=UPI001EE635B5|nr:YeiH family protein [Staphylococcus aureus]MCG5164487.1 YeiH family protein [Staphylococcus aureus]WIZ65717.1 YeiH family protein [Staphylococcus aureus]HCV1061923.1 YeiH family protein [Staphylococcus aureus]HDC5962807.1 YeiH family protein [Staphylococcus aureus]HDC7734400.1 YeiH family protein [Staphylococcus aureus]